MSSVAIVSSSSRRFGVRTDSASSFSSTRKSS